MKSLTVQRNYREERGDEEGRGLNELDILKRIGEMGMPIKSCDWGKGRDTGQELGGGSVNN